MDPAEDFAAQFYTDLAYGNDSGSDSGLGSIPRPRQNSETDSGFMSPSCSITGPHLSHVESGGSVIDLETALASRPPRDDDIRDLCRISLHEEDFVNITKKPIEKDEQSQEPQEGGEPVKWMPPVPANRYSHSSLTVNACLDRHDIPKGCSSLVFGNSEEKLRNVEMGMKDSDGNKVIYCVTEELERAERERKDRLSNERREKAQVMLNSLMKSGLVASS